MRHKSIGLFWHIPCPFTTQEQELHLSFVARRTRVGRNAAAFWLFHVKTTIKTGPEEINTHKAWGAVKMTSALRKQPWAGNGIRE